MNVFGVLSMLFFAVAMIFDVTTGDVINCEFKEKDGYGYICDIQSILSVPEDSHSFIGSHQDGKTDASVEAVYFDSYPSSLRLRKFDSSFCKTFPNLKIIEFWSVIGRAFNEDALDECHHLKKLTIVNAYLKELPENLLSGPFKLEIVKFHWNELNLTENFFETQDELKELWLRDNKINFLPEKIFHPLRNIEKLSLFSNKIETLHPKLFSKLENLQFLYLGQNKISQLPANIFAPLTSLKEVWLNENSLTVIHADSFGTLGHLNQVRLYGNKINAIDEKLIDQTAVSVLDMYENVCFRERLKVRSEMKSKLKKCFENYQPRVGEHAE